MVKLTYQGAATKPERIAQAGMDDLLTAQAVTDAPTPEAAWGALGVPAPFDPALRERLTGALARVLVASDAITKGHAVFDGLAPDEAPPVEWVDRMVELHVQELEAYWALDAEAVAGVAAGSWTATTGEPAATEEVVRIAQRARWQADVVKPPKPALWFTKLLGRLDRAAQTGEHVEEAGRALVAEATRRRFAGGTR